jgi:4-diphosphocytidyl-2-C-methyl-D-erythritol kinase
MALATEFAPAKINLALHVTGRRADGYHLLDSLVVFARVGDTLAARPSARLTLAIAGPFAEGLSAGPDNLVLRAARLVGVGAELTLTKILPVASGIGGGSADAGAALRLLSRLSGKPVPPPGHLLALGADVPVCVASRACRMSGIGEVLDPVSVPACWLVLANPGVPVPTGAVFAALRRRDSPPLEALSGRPGLEAFCGWAMRARNDLEAPAIGLRPVIGEVIAALAAQRGCRIARMSGSGATCFGVFAREADARAAADAIRQGRPDWWVEAAEAG